MSTAVGSQYYQGSQFEKKIREECQDRPHMTSGRLTRWPSTRAHGVTSMLDAGRVRELVDDNENERHELVVVDPEFDTHGNTMRDLSGPDAHGWTR